MTRVIFDLDDTLAHCALHFGDVKNEVYRTYFLPAGINKSDFEAQHKICEDINLNYHGMSSERFPLSLQQTYEALVSSDRKKSTEVFLAGMKIHDHSTWTPFPESTLVLDALAPKFELYLLTRGEFKIQKSKFDRFGFEKWFGPISDIAKSRLDSRAYTTMVKDATVYSQLRGPTKTIVVGDSIPSDIRPALDSGFDAIHVGLRNGVTPWAVEHDHTHTHERMFNAKDLHEVQTILESLL